MAGNFAEYLYALLHAPLKRGSKAANLFFIFFKAIGGLFDDCKQDIFRLREASMLAGATDAVLQLHGQDRDMARLKGETLDNYRERLLMKGIIAEAAGTNEGIRYVAQAFGYDNVIISTSSDPAHWAEATVQFIGGRIVIDDRALLLQELNKIKPARTLLTLSKEQRYFGTVHVGGAFVLGKEISMKQR